MDPKIISKGLLYSSYKIGKDLHSRSRKYFNQSAQGMVEFALTIPIILLMILGIIEGGRLLFIYSSLAAAGREAARYGAGIGNLGSGTPLYNDCAGIRNAAKRIGSFAGVTDSNIHIYHGTGLEQSLTEYCKPSNTVPFVKGDRVIIKIDLGYSTMSNLIPIPPLTLHTESAHTILMGAEVVAVDPPAIPGTGYQCDLTPYTISVDDPRAMSITVTIGQSHSGYATAITNIIVVWDKTGGPILKSIENPCSCSGVTTINSTGPFYQSGVNWTFVPGSTKKFKINFDKKLKSDVIIQLTLNDEHHCTIGK